MAIEKARMRVYSVPETVEDRLKMLEGVYTESVLRMLQMDKYIQDLEIYVMGLEYKIDDLTKGEENDG